MPITALHSSALIIIVLALSAETFTSTAHSADRYAGGLFGQGDFSPSQYDDEAGYVSFEEQLSTLNDIIKEGKVRYIGVSNETPFGVCSMCDMAKYQPELYPKIVSIQNSYSLLVRKDFEAGLAEACYHHNVGLLPYSPLAGGILTGKYRNESPEKGRLNLFPGFMDRYRSSLNEEAANAYGDIAMEVRFYCYLLLFLLLRYF